jgi:hypothetical protein
MSKGIQQTAKQHIQSQEDGHFFQSFLYFLFSSITAFVFLPFYLFFSVLNCILMHGG